MHESETIHLHAQAALSDNNIPESVYDNLVSTINEHLPLTASICETS